MWRHRDMEGLIKIWQAADIKARNILTKRGEREQKGDRAKIDKAMRFLRKRAISRVGKTLKSKGLGDLRDPEILQQMRDKHAMRIREIGPDMHTLVPEEPVLLKVEQILGKLKNDAALGPTRLRNNIVRMWMGAFAPATTETTIEHLTSRTASRTWRMTGFRRGSCKTCMGHNYWRFSRQKARGIQLETIDQ